MELTQEEARVLGCLIEKEATVSDSYPLTLNSLRLACNQSTSRDPIVAYDDRAVDAALLSLKSKGLVRFVHPSHGGRTTKYRQVADERWGFDRGELAVLSVLVLRGPQTAGELRTRTERQHTFDDVEQVEEVLDTLAARTPDPFVVRLDLQPGQKDPRWAHLLCGEPLLESSFAGMPKPAYAGLGMPKPAYAGLGMPDSGEGDHDAAELVHRIAALEARITRLEDALGIKDDG